jgi:acetolactate synthase-1/2/3 large subunit
MNGAERLLQTLVDSGVELCLANPGTSEMQLVSAIGDNESMRAVLCLFEGVVSGAADGYARMSDKPAITLLHLGSGFSNSMANQHNAKRAHVPLVNIVGDHATYHLKYDAPLTSDVPAHVRLSSDWVAVSESADDLAVCGAKAVQKAMQGWGHITTVVAPANHAWEPSTNASPALPLEEMGQVSSAAIEKVASALGNAKRTALFLGGRALREESLWAAGQIAKTCQLDLICETFPARLQRGVGRVPVQRLPYFAEQAAEVLSQYQQLILVGCAAPVSFFAYPGKPSYLAAENCEVITLADVHQDTATALRKLVTMLGADENAVVIERAEVSADSPKGLLTPLAMAQTVAQLMPENAIVSDEAATCGLAMYPSTVQSPAHDWLTLTGGAIGQGLPLSLGAALACPERKVISLQADGSAMYTLQALWTMARENTDVTVVVFNNRSYAILNLELARVGAGQPTPKTLSMFDLSRPDIDWVALSEGMGMPATKASSAEEFHQQFADAMTVKGPRLIEAMVVQQMPG